VSVLLQKPHGFEGFFALEVKRSPATFPCFEGLQRRTPRRGRGVRRLQRAGCTFGAGLRSDRIEKVSVDVRQLCPTRKA
jgi:hypothetical protein